MSRLWPEGEPITMQTDAQGRPVRFVWRGRAHRLAHIQQHWEVDVDWWHTAGRIQRAYLAITTVDGLFCVIYQDLVTQAWRLAKMYD